jgi:EAL domain-containing protein (putative c-di-GMP-specific phosphodiesterase class I)
VHLASGQVIGGEAFARWNHPVHGVVDPLVWLDVVEQSAELAIVTEHVLDRALAVAAAWRARGADVPVMVGISQRCLLDVRFAHVVLGRLSLHRLEPRHLVIELAETGGISQLDAVHAAMASLRSDGVRIVVDQFGASHDSLAMLTGLQALDGLKIDAAVVGEVGVSPEADLVVRAASQLARSLPIQHVGAEGVTTLEQRRTLWELGCTAGQGSLFADPMPPEEIVELLNGGGDRPEAFGPLRRRTAGVP